MALIKCKECGKEYSDKSASCPNCGCPSYHSIPIGDNFIKCKYCGCDISITSTVCSHCGAKVEHTGVPNREQYNYGTGAGSPPNNRNAPKEKKEQSTTSVILWLIFFFPVGLYKMWAHNKFNKVARIIISVFFALCVISSMVNSSSKSYSHNTKTENEYGKIDDFEYEISDSTILLSKYDGNDKIIEIKPTYEVDGVTYNTDISDFQVSDNDVETLIIDNGFQELDTAIFNGCDVINVFFPKSMAVMYDYTLSYFHPDNGEKIQIYYEGTEDEWNSIFTEYTTIQGADSTSEAIGQAAADFVNGLTGSSKLDSSEFEFHFSASAEELK